LVLALAYVDFLLILGGSYAFSAYLILNTKQCT
jgi:hypothetical protein